MKIDIFNTDKKYQIIYADPPWVQRKGGSKTVRPLSSGKELDYPVMSFNELRDIFWQIINISESNSVLFLWTIDKYLHKAEVLANEFTYKLHARMIWNKVTGIPSAFTIRFGHEYLLYMYRGKLLSVATNQRGKIHSVFTEQVKAHSQKPVIAYEILEKLYPYAEKLELFARREREGWDCWGNEV